jgi:hypothetical protein
MIVYNYIVIGAGLAPQGYNYIVIGLGLMLLVWLVWKEVRRPRRSRLAARVVATVLAVAAVTCLGLPVSCRRGKADMRGKEGLLLTDGYDADSVSLFLREHGGMKVIRSDDESMDRWHVFGYGLTKEEWMALRPPSLVFHASSVKVGLTSVDWRRKLRRGEPLRVQGHWKGDGIVRLLLEGMGQALDSTTVKGDSLFLLHAVPAQAGRGIYRFVAIAGKDTLEQEEIPFEVEAGKALKILVLASSPDAENTFLVSWLSKEGHAVASRTLVSKDKYRQVYANMAALPLGQLTSALLGDFDLVIADALTVSGGGLLPMLRRQVEEKGLGLVIRVDSGGVVGKRVLLRDSMGRAEVSVSREGMGKIVWTKHITYPMMLAGEKEGYAVYWASLLREAAREEPAGDRWEWWPEFPRVEEPVRFVLQTGVGDMPQGVVGRNVNMYLAEDGVLPYTWLGRYWPEAVGWQTVVRLQGDTSLWYAWGAGAWEPLYREKRKRETEAFIREMEGSAGSRGGLAEGDGGGAKRDRGLVKSGRGLVKSDRALMAGGGVAGWFYALLIVSLLFLWIEKKIL